MIQVLATMGPAVDKLDLTKELAKWHGIGPKADAAGSSSEAPKKRKTEWSPSLTADRAPMMKKRSATKEMGCSVGPQEAQNLTAIPEEIGAEADDWV